MPIANIPFLLIKMFNELPYDNKLKLKVSRRLPLAVIRGVYTLQRGFFKGMIDDNLFINQ